MHILIFVPEGDKNEKKTSKRWKMVKMVIIFLLFDTPYIKKKQQSTNVKNNITDTFEQYKIIILYLN